MILVGVIGICFSIGDILNEEKVNAKKTTKSWIKHYIGWFGVLVSFGIAIFGYTHMKNNET